MPVCFIEAPQGMRMDAKKKLVEKTSAALHEAFQLDDTRVFIREYPLENVGQDGHLQTELRPICFVEAPKGTPIDAKRTLVRKINEAVTEALSTARSTLIFVREYALEDVAEDGRLQAENPDVLEVVKRLSAN